MNKSTIEYLKNISVLQNINSANIKKLKILITNDWSWDLIGIGREDFPQPIKFNQLTIPGNGISDSFRFPIPCILGKDVCAKSIDKDRTVLLNHDLPQTYRISIDEIGQLYHKLSDIPNLTGIEQFH